MALFRKLTVAVDSYFFFFSLDTIKLGKNHLSFIKMLGPIKSLPKLCSTQVIRSRSMLRLAREGKSRTSKLNGPSIATLVATAPVPLQKTKILGLVSGLTLTEVTLHPAFEVLPAK